MRPRAASRFSVASAVGVFLLALALLAAAWAAAPAGRAAPPAPAPSAASPPQGQWTPASAVLATPLRSPTMVYSPEINRTLVFDPPADNHTTWAYDASSDAWSSIPDAAVWPSFLASSMVYDPDVGRMILFGGVAGTMLLGETNATWTYDAVNDTWTNVTPVHSPPPRFFAGMAYDASAHRMIVFGGLRFGCIGGCIPEIPDVPLRDTWAYDAVNNTWTNVTPAASPPARGLAGMAYDPVTQRTVLFGGIENDNTGNGALFNDTWVFDARLDQWGPVAASGPSPSPRSAMAMAYDPEASGIVLFGGSGASGPMNDTWWYWPALNAWTPVPSAQSPSGRSRAGLAFDEVTGKLVLFGGIQAAYPYWVQDVWLYRVVSAPLAITLDVSSHAGQAPFGVTARGAAGGGTPPYAFSWTFGDGGQATGESVSHTYQAAGNYSLTLTVHDSGGGVETTATMVTVSAPPQSLGPGTSNGQAFPWTTVGLAAGGVLLLVVVAVGVLLSRRKGPKG